MSGKLTRRWWKLEGPASPDVFISYSSKDGSLALEVCSALEAAQLRCWIAPRDVVAGREWAGAIVDGVTTCRAFVLLLSVHSNASAQVRREVELASRSKKPIVALRIENVEPSGPLQYYLAAIQWFDATRRPLRPRLSQFVDTMGAVLGEQPVGPPPDDRSAPGPPVIPEVTPDDFTRVRSRRGNILGRIFDDN